MKVKKRCRIEGVIQGYPPYLDIFKSLKANIFKSLKALIFKSFKALNFKSYKALKFDAYETEQFETSGVNLSAKAQADKISRGNNLQNFIHLDNRKES